MIFEDVRYCEVSVIWVGFIIVRCPLFEDVRYSDISNNLEIFVFGRCLFLGGG